MGEASVVSLMLVAAAALQVAAALFALALIPLSGMRKSWSAVAIALLLQGVRRAYLLGPGTSMSDATAALSISILLLGGVVGMRAVFLAHRKTQQLLDAEREGHDAFAGRAGALVVMLDAQARILDLNARACSVLECDVPAVRGLPWFDTFVRHERRRELLEGFRQLMASSEETDEYVEYEVLDMAGHPHTVVWHRRLLLDPSGVPVAVRSAGIDLTERRALEEELGFRSMLLDHTNDAVMVYDAAGNVLYANEQAKLYRGGLARVQVGADMHDLLLPAERSAFDLQAETVAGGACMTFETTGVGTDGVKRPLESHACPIVLNVRRLVLEVARDVTDRRRAESAMRRMAYSDPLTGLANRVMLFDRAQVAMAHARRSGRSLGVLFLDLDAMKEVNDTCGHAAGDELLQLVGGRLADAFRGEDTVARMGGDEFVILAGVETPDKAEDVAERVSRLMSDPFTLGAGEVTATCSIGIAVYPRDGEDFQALLATADTAMYDAKANSRSRRDTRAAGA